MIFVDTGVYYARIADDDDEHHREAEDFFRRSKEPHLTTTAVVYEAHALMLRIDRGAASAHIARGFLDEIDGLSASRPCDSRRSPPSDRARPRSSGQELFPLRRGQLRRDGATPDQTSGVV
jgi:hypothetical protein